MKKDYLIIALLIILGGCAYKIKRTGYAISEEKFISCEVVIKKKARVYADEAVMLGSIKLGDGGMTVGCRETDAIDKLRSEACSLGADFVNITEEKGPDLWSTCYRCRATFYKLKDN